MSQLITLARAKEQVPNASAADDAHISELITACSATVENYCNRTFTQQQFDELYSGDNSVSVFVNNPPIVSVQAVRTTPLPALYVLNNDSTHQYATVSVNSTGLTLTTLKNATTTTHTFLWATYPSISQLVTAINGAGDSWQAILSGQFATWASSDLALLNFGDKSARNLTVSLLVHWFYFPNYQVTPNTGEIVLFGGFVLGKNNWRITYTGGFATIPEDVQQAVAELVQHAHASRKWTPGVQSETLDRYSYTRAAVTSLDNLSITAKRALQQYRISRPSRSFIV